MLTLKQIIKKLEEIRQAHAQLNDFHFGDPPEFGSEWDISYPFMGVMLVPGGALGNKTDRLKLRLFFAGLVNRGLENKLETLSDMRVLAQGVYAQFRAYLADNSITLDRDAPLDDFEGSWDDDAYGYSLDITVDQFYSSDSCQEPSTFVSSRTENGHVIIYNIETGATIETLLLGDSYGVLQFSGIFGGNASTVFTNQIVGG